MAQTVVGAGDASGPGLDEPCQASGLGQRQDVVKPPERPSRCRLACAWARGHRVQPDHGLKPPGGQGDGSASIGLSGLLSTSPGGVRPSRRGTLPAGGGPALGTLAEVQARVTARSAAPRGPLGTSRTRLPLRVAPHSLQAQVPGPARPFP